MASSEAHPDLLRNTPSNIKRLEVEIEHSKGRQKYLAHTRSPSDGGDVRWYFYKVPLAENELAASVPRTEIVGKSDYFRFGMRDSLAIEASFLQQEEDLLSSWWKEYAECSEGPRGRPSSSKVDKQQCESSSEGARSAQLYEVEEERVGVPVKGGLYEVDLVKRHCFPVYWNGENRRVLRGHWFARKGGLDWLPLREDVAEQLEIAYRSQVWHRRTFQPSGLFAARVDLQGSTPWLHALFTGEDDTWEAWLNVDASGFSGAMGFSGSGIKIRRGYSTSHSPKPTQDELRQQKEEEMDDYCSQVPVQHLVFMIHGIGQRLEKSNLVDDVTNFRHVTSSLAERHLTSHQRGAQRVLFIPCQWRKGLKLSGEAAVDKITLDGVRGLRVTLSATVHDVLYYMSPIYCQDIIDSVSIQLNRLYLKFLKRNPGYDGKVSIYGHSLGSVLSYDILCHQESLSSPFPMDWMYKEHARNEESSPDVNNQSSLLTAKAMDSKQPDEKLPSGQDDASMNYTPNIKYMKLEFKVDTFFAVGSPLGVFLTLRNIRIGIGKGKEYWGEENISEEMPACRQMFNIFHPFDPVAYRSVIVPLLH
ncbi:phospholipase sgr2 [Quercus suber]|uniref:Phospholipase sgr2 n=1 Tax=Quercus suber TaxID=58331 RepID=A0AAW0LNG4_QUESU